MPKPSRRVRLLISSRDPGAANSLVPVIRTALDDVRFRVFLVAHGPAARIFEDAGFSSIVSTSPPVMDRQENAAKKLIDEARALVDGVQPDALLVGLSGPDAGIDEALLASVDDGLPTFALQDYWGDVNTVLGRAAQTYFVADEYASSLTLDRYDVRTRIVGQPRYIELSTSDLGVSRSTKTREASPVFGFFGQNLWKHAGYPRTLRLVGEAIRDDWPDARFVYRPHPKEGDPGAKLAADIVRGAGVAVAIDTSPTTNRLVLGSDLVMSIYSTACYDAAHWNRISPQPLASPVYVLIDKGLRELIGNMGLIPLPPVVLGVCGAIADQEFLRANLLGFLGEAGRRRLWLAAKENLEVPADAPVRMLTHIHDAVSARKHVERAS